MVAAQGSSSRFTPHLAGGALFASAVGWFGSNQQLWTDEATQLSGLRLNPIEVVGWLAGADRQRFGVPGDRMPPFSYWIGWLWSQVFGLSESSLRLMAAAAVGLALLLVVETARQCFGSRSAWLAAITCGLSANWITFGAEIRTYPLLLLASAVAFWAFAQLCLSAKHAPRHWVVMSVACLCASYAHFFGLVLTGAIGGACLMLIYRNKLSWKLPVALTVGLGAFALGLLPFLRSALEMSQAPDAAPRAFPLAAAVRLLYRLLGGHPAVGFSIAVSVLVVVGVASCIGLTLAYSRLAVFPAGLAVSLILGVGADLFAGVMSKGFDPFTAAYNVWMLPPVGLLLAGCVSNERLGRSVLLGNLAAVTALLGTVLGAGNLMLHSPVYSHSPARQIAERVRALAQGDLNRVVVVHDAGEEWGHAYFPLLYEFGTNVQQVLAKENNETHLLELARLPEQTPLALADLRSKRLLLATTRHEGASELGRFVTSREVPELARLELSRALQASGCEKQATQAFVALNSTEVSTLQCR